MRWIAFFAATTFTLLVLALPGAAQTYVLPEPSDAQPLYASPSVRHQPYLHPKRYHGLLTSLMNNPGYVRPQPAVAEQDVDTRRVTVSLCVAPPGASPSVNFRLKRAGEVLAEKPADPRDKLEYELLIHGPTGDFKVHIPIGANSSIRSVYEQYGTEQPELVVDALAELGEPVVSVVAIRRQFTTQHYGGSQAGQLLEFSLWTPYYRIELGDPDTVPQLVQVPRVDDSIYRLARRKANLHLKPSRQFTVVQISGAETPKALADSRPKAVPPRAPNDLPFPDPFSSDEA